MHLCSQTVPIRNVFTKLNLKIEYRPLYKCLIWNYKKADVDMINRAIELFDWNKLFESKNVHHQVCLFNKNVLNVFPNFVPAKLLLVITKIHHGLMMK